MKQTKFFGTREDGVNLYRTYSDKNCYLERDGQLYTEAVDPEGSNREYNETDIQIYIPPEMAKFLENLENEEGE